MRYFLSLSLVVLAFIANARQITPDEAQAVAQDFFNNSAVDQSRAPRAIRARSLNAAQTEENAPYYIFNASDNNGFVIISGDDRAKKIIGYSDKGNFDVTNMPPQLSAMLDNFAQSLSELTGSTADQSWTAPTRAASSNDGVLLETANWGQGYPYNAQCPIIDGVQAPTGCVATAMAIIMKYHNWPVVGKYENYYRLSPDGPENEFSWDFANYHPAWGLLKNGYESSNVEDESLKAISDLMMATGIASRVNYRLFSSTTSVEAFVGLRRFFGYGSKLKFYHKSNVSDTEWINLIRQEINNNRPIFYACNLTDGSVHALVIDGYSSSNGMLHVNWGWDGNQNGYYALDDISPSEREMVVGIEKPGNDDILYSDYYISPDIIENPIYAEMGAINISVENVGSGEPFNLVTPSILWPSHSDAIIGLALVDSNNNIKEVIQTNRFFNSQDDWFSQPTSFSNVKYDGVVDSNDRIQIVAQENGESTWKYVNSQHNRASSIPVIGNNPNTKPITWKIDPRLYILFYGPNGPTSWYPFYTKKPFEDIDPKMNSVLYGYELEGHVDFNRCAGGRMNAAACRVNGIMRASQIFDESVSAGTYLQFVLESGTIDLQQSFYDVEIIGHSEEDGRTSLEIIVADKNSVSQYCANHDCTHITDLKLIGVGNGDEDLRPIFNNMPFMMSLDLSDYKPINRTIRPYVFSSVVDGNYSLPDILLEIERGEPWVTKTGLQCLREMKLPTELDSIKAGAFFLCNLDHITIPRSVKYIGARAFYTNSSAGTNLNLKYVVCESTEPAELCELGFGELGINKAILYVPKGSRNSYMNSPEWSKFTQILEYEGEFGAIDNVCLDKDVQYIEIFNIQGIKVFQGKTSDMPSLPSGIYLKRIGDKVVKIVI